MATSVNILLADVAEVRSIGMTDLAMVSLVVLVVAVLVALQASPERLEQLRSELRELVRGAFRDNQMHQHFLLTRATKHG